MANPNSKLKCKYKPCAKYQPREQIKDNYGFCDVGCRAKWALEKSRKDQIKAKKKQESDLKKKEKEKRAFIRKRKEEIKTKPRLTKETQLIFNLSIRLRDYKEPCVSCGRYEHEIRDTFIDHKWDCGHFLSVGSHPELRFERKNAYKQCASCNGGSGQFTKKNYMVSKAYRINLIEKIGIGEVEWLEGDHKAKNYTHDQLRSLKIEFKRDVKIYKEIIENDIDYN